MFLDIRYSNGSNRSPENLVVENTLKFHVLVGIADLNVPAEQALAYLAATPAYSSRQFTVNTVPAPHLNYSQP